MNAHLTHEEMTERLMGAKSATVEAHLMECPACSQELQSVRQSIQMFRGAVHSWSEAQPVLRAGNRVPVKRPFDWVLAGAMAAILLFFAMLFVVDHRNQQQAKKSTPAPLDAATQIKQDNELLSEVNQELSEAVPAPMQPLQDSTSSGAKNSSK